MKRPKLLISALVIVLTCLIALNQRTVLVYYRYLEYKIYNDNIDINASLRRVINSATDAGYSCTNKSSAIEFVHRQIRKRSTSYSTYRCQYCVELPTGEIIISTSNGSTKYCFVITKHPSNLGSYHILDIRGETLG